MNETITRLEQYGALLKAAGFRVWVNQTSPSGGYLTYERGGFYGHLQCDYWGNWAHDMPLVPSKEAGSSMFIGKPVADVWSVEAAEQAASEYNHNDVVGRRRNAGDKTWISPSAHEL